jgi:iron complex transport system permease protein
MPLSGSRLIALATALALLTLGVVAAALAFGSAGLDLEMIRTLRAPRVAAAAGIGALLALSGLAMQSLLRNPLADPYVLGTSGGAAVGSLLALMFGAAITVCAAAGALAAGALLLWLARRALATTDDASPRLILAGAMLAALFGAMASLLLALTPDQRLRGAIFWLVGDLSGADDGGGCLRPPWSPGSSGASARWTACCWAAWLRTCSASRCGVCASNCCSARRSRPHWPWRARARSASSVS